MWVTVAESLESFFLIAYNLYVRRVRLLFLDAIARRQQNTRKRWNLWEQEDQNDQKQQQKLNKNNNWIENVIKQQQPKIKIIFGNKNKKIVIFFKLKNKIQGWMKKTWWCWVWYGKSNALTHF